MSILADRRLLAVQPATRWVYVALCAMVRDCKSDGMAVVDDATARMIGVPPNTLRAFVNELSEVGLVTVVRDDKGNVTALAIPAEVVRAKRARRAKEGAGNKTKANSLLAEPYNGKYSRFVPLIADAHPDFNRMTLPQVIDLLRVMESDPNAHDISRWEPQLRKMKMALAGSGKLYRPGQTLIGWLSDFRKLKAGVAEQARASRIESDRDALLRRVGR